MNRSSINTRYAKAYVSMACEKNILEHANNDIRILYAALHEYTDFCNYIQDNRISIVDKTKNIEKLFSKEFNPLTINFLKLIFHNKREEFLKDICRNTIELICKNEGIINAKLTTAIDMDAKTIALFCQKFEEKTHTKVELSTETKPSIIGGLVLRINGMQYDASIATSLKEITKQFFNKTI